MKNNLIQGITKIDKKSCNGQIVNKLLGVQIDTELNFKLQYLQICSKSTERFY